MSAARQPAAGGGRAASSPPAARPRHLEGLALLLVFQFAGETLVRLLDLSFPGNVVGMALLLAALLVRIVPLRWVEQAADSLLSILALLFVPPGVGVVLYLDLLADEWLAIGAAVLVGTLTVIAVTGWLAAATARRTAATEPQETGVGE